MQLSRSFAQDIEGLLFLVLEFKNILFKESLNSPIRGVLDFGITKVIWDGYLRDFFFGVAGTLKFSHWSVAFTNGRKIKVVTIM